MVRICTSKMDEKGHFRITSLGKIQFDENGVSEKEFELEEVEGLCQISPTLSVVGEEKEESSSGRGRGKKIDKKIKEEPEGELSEENKEILKNLKESSGESIFQMLESLEVEKGEYSNIDITEKGGIEALINFAFEKLKK